MNKKITAVLSNPLFSLILSVLILWIDYITGPEIEFPILFIIPVVLITWYRKLRCGILFSVTLPVITVYYNWLWHDNTAICYILINTVIRVMVLVIFSFLISVIKAQQLRLSKRVDTLEKILPICSYCKRIREKDDSWHTIEEYFSSNTESRFSHGLCPDCARKYYKDFYK